MKMNKYFMLGLAGLAFAACSNEEDAIDNGNPTLDGNAVVSVKIATPAMTRNAGAATNGNPGDKVDVTGTIVVTLTGTGADGAPYNQSISVDAATYTGGALKFWNVAKPEKLTASINGGDADYTQVSIATVDGPNPLQVAAEKIPAYGETVTFTRTEDVDSPDMDQDGKTEEGANDGDQNKDYEMYTATVNMAIPVARLEVSGIYHVTHTGTAPDQCIYGTLTLDGAYLDGYCEYGSKYTNGAFPNSSSQGENYCMDGTSATGDGEESALKDEISAINFLQTTASAPVGPYTYNFFANGTNPVFKLYFATAEESDSYTEGQIRQPRYAMVTEYTDEDGAPVTFENGHIYRITKAELKDTNIIGDEGGNTLYGISVTVVEAQWEIVNIGASWAEEGKQ